MAGKNPKNMAMVASSEPSLELREISIPKPEPHQLLVKVSHAAQNPTDVQSFDQAAFGDGAVYGCDFVGEVIEVGDDVRRFSVGDVVAALIWGGEVKGVGAYANYCIADEKITYKVPEGLDRASASTLPLAITTAWLALFSNSLLDIDRGKKQSVLIWGGSSSVGQYAIQLAAIYSLNIITTCSPRNFELAKRLGADHILDYKDPDVVEKIRNAAPDINHVFDTIGSKDSSKTACEAAQADCTLCTVRPGKANTDDVPSTVKITDVLVWTAFLKDHYYGEFHWPPKADDHKLCAELYENIPAWLTEGKIKPNEVLPLQGLEAVNEGFQKYRDGAYSAQKIVYEF